MKNKRARLLAKQEKLQADKFFKIKFALGFIIACGFLYLAWYSYATQVSSIDEADLPLIKAPVEAVKVKPDDPGGLKIGHKDKEIYDHIAGKKSFRKEKLIKNNDQPASYDKIKETIKKEGRSNYNSKNKNDNGLKIKPVILNIPKNISKTIKKITKPKTYYLRLAAIKSPRVLKEAWTILRAKYPQLKSLQPKITIVKKGGKTIYFLEAGKITSKAQAVKVCNAIIKSGGKCKVN